MLSLQNGVGISRAAPYGVGVFDRADETSDAAAVAAGKSAVYVVKQEPASSFSIVPHNGHDSHEGSYLHFFYINSLNYCCFLIWSLNINFFHKKYIKRAKILDYSSSFLFFKT